MEEKVVYIVGLGLIGASLAMGIRKAHPQVTLLGYNRSQASRDIALKNDIVDEVTADLEEFASRADVIIVSLPVKQTIQTFQQLAKIPLKEGVIVTDVGSTKGAIVEAGQEFLIISQSVLSAGIPWREVTRQELPQLTPRSLKMPTIFLPQQLRQTQVRSWN